MERHILFIERDLEFLRPGGRMAIVLPQGVLNNTNMEYVRNYLLDKARILAVVGLHGNTFKPHAGVKTSILFLQKLKEGEKIRKIIRFLWRFPKRAEKIQQGIMFTKKTKKGMLCLIWKGKKLLITT